MSKYILCLAFFIATCLSSLGCYSFPVEKGWLEPVEMMWSEKNNPYVDTLVLDDNDTMHLSWIKRNDQKSKVEALYYLKFKDAISDIPEISIVFSRTDFSTYQFILDSENNPYFFIPVRGGFFYTTFKHNKWSSPSFVRIKEFERAQPDLRKQWLAIDENGHRHLVWYDYGFLYYMTSVDDITWTKPLKYSMELIGAYVIWNKNMFNLIWYDSSDPNNRHAYYATLSTEGVLSEPKQLPYPFYAGIGIDRNGNPHIVMTPPEDNSFYYYYYCSLVNGQWISDRIPWKLLGGSFSVVRFSILLDSYDRPHLYWTVFQPGTSCFMPNKSRAYCTFFDGQKWQKPYRMPVGSMVIDKNDTIHFIWADKSRESGSKTSLYYSSHKIPPPDIPVSNEQPKDK